MRLLVQRALRGSVTVEGRQVSSIGRGIVALVGIKSNDEQADADWIARRLLNLRLWPDENGRPWSKNVVEMGYEILCVSQFTLHAVFKGTKPDFHLSMSADRSKAFYDNFLAQLRKEYRPDRVLPGEFGSMMEVALVNDGPVTFMLDSKKGDDGDELATAKPAAAVTQSSKQEKGRSKAEKGADKQEKGEMEKPASKEVVTAVATPSTTASQDNVYQLRVLRQPPAMTVYQRILKPMPEIALLGGSNLGEENLFVEASLHADNTEHELPLALEGTKVMRVSSGVPAIFKRLKILVTSQSQRALFKLRFTLKRYNGTSFDTIAGVTTLSDLIEVFSHTTYLTRNGPIAMDEEESQPNDAAAVPPLTTTELHPHP